MHLARPPAKKDTWHSNCENIFMRHERLADDIPSGKFSIFTNRRCSVSLRQFRFVSHWEWRAHTHTIHTRQRLCWQKRGWICLSLYKCNYFQFLWILRGQEVVAVGVRICQRLSLATHTLVTCMNRVIHIWSTPLLCWVCEKHRRVNWRHRLFRWKRHTYSTPNNININIPCKIRWGNLNIICILFDGPESFVVICISAMVWHSRSRSGRNHLPKLHRLCDLY